MVEERILNKIKKCLALSQSPEPHEAAAALRQAQKLMEKYGVDQRALGKSEFGSTDIKSKASVSRIKDWELSLVKSVAGAFGCKLLWRGSFSRSSDPFGEFNLIGLKDQVEVAEYTIIVLQRKLMSARADFVRSLPDWYDRRQKTVEADGFCHGWVGSIKKTIVEFAMPEEQSKLLDEYVAERTRGETTVQRRRIGAAGYGAGQQAAAGESIHRPVNETKRARLTH